MPRICIIAHNSFGAMTGGRCGHVGGAEHQTALLARWMAGKGFPTSLLTWDEGQADNTVIDGVRVIKMCGPGQGLPGVRFFHPRLSSLYAAMKRADASVYYHNSAEYVTGLAAAWCRRHGRKFISSVASDVACDPALPALRKSYERILYRYGIRHADRLIVQTNRQQKMLRDGFGLESVVLPMPCPGPSASQLTVVAPARPPQIAWVGRLVELKRLEWLLTAAERLPQVNFRVVGATNADNAYARAMLERGRALSNVMWAGTVAREGMPEIYQRASGLCCTSIYEGFPNTFLEAWSHGRPVITSVDPDGVVARLNLGWVARSVDELVEAINALLNSPDQWREKSSNGRRYYLENHELTVAMPRFEQELAAMGRAIGLRAMTVAAPACAASSPPTSQ